MSGQPAVLQVVILRDGLLVGTEVLIPGTYAIGSSPQADLRLDDPSIGERHAILYFQNGKAAIQDAGTPGGVYVNGHRVTACQVRSVDEVVCGPFVLKIRVLAQKPVERDQPPPEVAALLMTPAQGVAPAEPEPPAAQAYPSPRQMPPDTAPSTRAPQRPATDQATVPSVRVRSSTDERPAVPLATHPPRATGPGQPQRAAQGRPAAPATQPRTTGELPAPARPAPAPPPPDAAPEQEPDLLGMLLPETAEEPPPSDGAEQPELLLDGGDFPMEAATRPVPAPRSSHSAPTARMRAAPAQPARPAQARPAAQPRPAQGQPAQARPAQARPAQARAAAPAGLPRTVRVGPGGKGKPRLYAEFYWGDIRCEAKNFLPGEKKKPIVAAPSEEAPLPVYGFSLPEEGFVLAQPQGDAFRVFVPPGATVERCKFSEPYTPVDPRGLDAGEGGRSITLSSGMAVRFTDGDQHALVAYVAPPPERVFVNPLRGLPHVAIATFILLVGTMVALSRFIPRQDDLPDFSSKDLAPVAVRLIAPEPKKKEEAKKKLQEIKAAAEEKKKKKVEKAEKVEKVVKQVEKSVPKAVAAAPETKALKALAKLSAAGPAMNDLLAAVDKLGSGPGSKNSKTNYKLSGLIGKAPITSAGLGTFGLGGGGKGGGATLGAELLRGKGGGGIGALGAGSVGKGAVGGTVSHATARAISATQGSIDREAVAKVVNSHLHEVFACYEKALLKDPSLAGKVMLEWTIGSSGRVTAVKTKSSTLRSGAVESCIIDNLKGWSFPTPKGGSVIITYPFVFNSVGY